ncbi:MAG: 5'-methylthioadenosine/adenosylhomocysteine nucleosidase [Clostridia bacterium]|nr:5'-methylthioadenosine/adenosylhomocysteine nucleosidase [Clostridia bacterium]
MTGIIGAMQSEIELIAEYMKKSNSYQAIEISGYLFHKGKIGENEVTAVVCGIGKVCAAAITQLLIDRFDADCIVNTGVAGGIGDGLEVGDIVVSEDAVQYDFDLTAIGYAQGYMPCLNQGKDNFSRFVADTKLTDDYLRSANKCLKNGKAVKGRILSGDRFVADNSLKNYLKSTFAGTAVEMEGAAIAQVCYLNKKPFTLVRAISDLANEEAETSYDTFAEEASHTSASVIIDMFESGRKTEN